MRIPHFLKQVAGVVVVGTLLGTVAAGISAKVELWTNAPPTIPPSAVQSVVPINTTYPSSDKVRFMNEMTWEEVIENVRTPLEAQIYLDYHLSYSTPSNDDGTIESFKMNHSDREGVCYDYAMAAAALLSDNGYPPLVLHTYKPSYNHAVFLYREGDTYFALGNTPVIGGAASIDELVREISDIMEVDYRTYAIFNLDDYYGEWWISGDGSKSQAVNIPPWDLVPVAR